MDGLIEYLEKHGFKRNTPHNIKSIIMCEKCSQPLKVVGAESNDGQNGFNEYFYCKKCNVGIDISVNFFEDGEVRKTPMTEIGGI